MKYLRDVNWQTIFTGWRAREAGNPGWIHTATEVKGWPDWESWRRFTAQMLGAEQLDWQLFEFSQPLTEIPAMLVGPFGGWQSHLPEDQRLKTSFAEFLEEPERLAWAKSISAVAAMSQQFPADTEFVGIMRDDTNQVVCLEGHHRAMAVAVAHHEGRELDIRGARIALARLPNATTVLGSMLVRGTSQVPPL